MSFLKSFLLLAADLSGNLGNGTTPKGGIELWITVAELFQFRKTS
jgi:hypothetical protein